MFAENVNLNIHRRENLKPHMQLSTVALIHATAVRMKPAKLLLHFRINPKMETADSPKILVSI
jgi:hypothetical protein